ncbi:MAG: hypothetical protein M1818_007799 [Claussenomyces sp. TS43310]|nr:MAG: hypothetical protein M1818_007799 [Claussenomyces sp. TS43310]
MAAFQPNPFLLAADNPSQLIAVLRDNPNITSEQDEHGYSLLHAAASYNHLDLLRALVTEFRIDVNIKDEDGETALFVAETVECAKLLVEELHVDTTIRGEEGKTAREKITAEEEFPQVAIYLMIHELEGTGAQGTNVNGSGALPSSVGDIIGRAPPLPQGVSIDVGTMATEEVAADPVDPGIRGRIEELAARADFEGEDGQRELRDLITEVLSGQMGDEREVRQRTN